MLLEDFPDSTMDKNTPVSVGDPGLIPEPGRSNPPWSI